MTCDPEADAAYIYVADGVARGKVVTTKLFDHPTPGASVILAFDSDNRLLGVELLGFSRLVPANVLEQINQNSADVPA